MVKSIEPQVANWGNRQIEDLNWPAWPEQTLTDKQIVEALAKSPSKQGGEGGGRPDHTIMLTNGAKTIPVFVEYKGTKGKLEKLSKQDLVVLRNDKNEFDYTRVISKYAVNGAAYYARNVVIDTIYKEVLAVGVNGFATNEDDSTTYEVTAYVVNAVTPELPILLGRFSDLSFLHKNNMTDLFQQIADVQTDPDELHAKQLEDEARLDAVLKGLNQFFHEETKITVSQRIKIVTASIMAGIGVKDTDGMYTVSPLDPSALAGSREDGETDGDRMYAKVKNFLKKTSGGVIPAKKQEQVLNSLKQVLIYSNLQVVDKSSGTSPLRDAYQKVYENLIPAYNMTGTMDFTGKLFNVMNDWVDIPDGGANDVVLTPRFVTDVMARMVGVNKNSYVWDWALGSGGFLISAMNLMLEDAKNTITSPAELIEKQLHIKSRQLLGIEKLADVYVLAVLNMILMGDGSSNILNEDSLLDFDGKYAYSEDDEDFPANVFLLNPPYSAPGKGMIFVENALAKMTGGKAAVIIQDSAGSGQATEFNKRVLQNNRLIASIKMPGDLFKASVQTSIYVFEVGVPHEKDSVVRFIDFREDGYKRSNRKKASTNLVDTGTAKERYAELARLVKNGSHGAVYYKFGDGYYEDTIDPTKGNDWNVDDHIIRDVTPTQDDFGKVVGEYLVWDITQMLLHDSNDGE